MEVQPPLHIGVVAIEKVAIFTYKNCDKLIEFVATGIWKEFLVVIGLLPNMKIELTHLVSIYLNGYQLQPNWLGL